MMTVHADPDSAVEERPGDPPLQPPCATSISGVMPRDGLRAAFLDGMRRVATTVTVVTTDGPAGRHGATVSAFASVSADPPTVLVCLRSASRIGVAVARNGVFTVNALSEGDDEVARIFAGAYDAGLVDRFAGIDLASWPGLAPAIIGAASFACRVTQMITQHTHSIAIGEVVRVAAARRAPLLYLDATYGRFQRDDGTQRRDPTGVNA